MTHPSAPFVAAVVFSILSLSNLPPALGQAPVEIKPIAPSNGTAPAPVAPPAVPVAAPAAPVAPASPVAQPVEQKKYVVKAGDNPWKIAKAHGISLEELLKANEIKDSKKLAIGDVLLLPAGVESKGAPAPAANPAPAAPAPVTAPAAGDDWELYTIKSGDNPWNISRRLKVDHQKIMSLNEGLDFTKLKIGQQIKVPKKAQ
jgi:LysM repeat protein